MAPTDSVVEVRGLRKSYGDYEAVRGIDFTIERGTIFGLLGPNGAGKTTTVEILEGYRARGGGDVSVLGADPGRDEAGLRDRIGIVLQESGLEPDFTVREVIDLYGAAYARRRDTAELIELVGLAGNADARTGTLSGGERRRLDFALGIVGDPDLLFLDEPTTGFDPEARRHAWEVIGALREEGKTILLTTHYMDEAQQLADMVAVLAHGRIVATGPPEELTDSSQVEAEVEFALPTGFVLTDLPVPASATLLGSRANGSDHGARVRFSTATPTRDLTPLVTWASERRLELDGLAVRRPTLEDVYLTLTTQEAER